MIASRAALPTGEPLTVQERAVLEEVVDVLACDVEGASTRLEGGVKWADERVSEGRRGVVEGWAGDEGGTAGRGCFTLYTYCASSP